MTGWVAVQALRETVRSFGVGWREVPEQRRNTWLWTVTAGWAALAALMLLLAWLGHRLLDGEVETTEESFLHWLVEAAPFSFGNAVFLESPGNAVVLVPVVLVAAAVAARRQRALLALSILASFFLLGAVVLLGWTVWERARPEAIHEGIASPGFSAFPSGHVAQALSVYGFLAYLWIRHSPRVVERLLAVLLVGVLVLVIAVSRLVMGTHWPTDTAAGAVLGGAWLLVLIAAIRRAER